MTSMTLRSLLTPRSTVFEDTKSETVLDLGQLVQGRINAQAFFEENFVTAGMSILLEQGFRRLSGQPGNGVFLLRQSMGGGKTHNLITFGLLAANPLLRAQVLTDPALEPVLRGAGKVEVVAFSGRTKPEYGLWGLIADQLGNKAAFNSFYAPLQAPGQEHWEALLRGRTALILLDELPPYLEDVRSAAIGNSDLARVTTTALTNLMAALQSPGCERVALVMTDLGSTAYSAGSDLVKEALANLKNETRRLAVELEPVQQNSSEIYDILRIRLFQQTPDDATIRQIRDLYAHEIDRARQMGLTASDGQTVTGALLDTYPFHPSVRDLYGRFRENPGFQQTRGLIRMMRATVRHLWADGPADERHLIGLQELDFNDDQIRSELMQINPYLKDAISHDVASEGKAVAEQNEPQELSREAATLLLASSLSQLPDGLVGLSAAEVADILARPGFDIAPLAQVLSELAHRSWYLHKDGATYRFTQNRNINAEIETNVSTMSEEKALTIVREQLLALFAPLPDGAYQQVLVFPQLDEIRPDEKQVTLVLARPQQGGLNAQLTELYNASTRQNRLMFLTGEKSNYQTLIDRAKVLQATQMALGTLRRNPHSAREDVQELEARVQDTQLQFFTAAQEAFTRLYFPDTRGLSALDFTGKFAEKAPASRGAEQLQQVLISRKKFLAALDDADASKFEVRVFGGSKRLSWSELQKRAASTPAWVWHPSGALDDLRRKQVDLDRWRMDGNDVLIGPFAREATSVTVRAETLDGAADRYRLTVTPKYGKAVHWAPGDTVDAAAPVMDSLTQDVEGQKFSFLAVDPDHDPATVKGHPTGEGVTWLAPTWLQGAWESETVTLQASPGAQVRVTFDGSAPEHGQVIDMAKPVTLPAGTLVVQAIATRAGLNSAPVLLKRNVTGPDPHKPTTWRRRHQATSTAESMRLLERLGKHQGKAAGVKVVAAGEGERYGAATFSSVTEFSADQLQQLSAYIRDLVGKDTDLNLTVEELRFGRGQQLADWADNDGLKLNMTEVLQ